jgi:transposase
MISLLPPGVRIFVACDPVDGRKSFDSLAALVKSALKKEPLDGSIFVFRNKTGHRHDTAAGPASQRIPT